MDEFTKYVLTAIVPATVAFVGWTIVSVIRLGTRIDTLKLHVSDNYTKHKDLDEIKKELRELSRMMYSIAGKLGVPTKE